MFVIFLQTNVFYYHKKKHSHFSRLTTIYSSLKKAYLKLENKRWYIMYMGRELLAVFVGDSYC